MNAAVKIGACLALATLTACIQPGPNPEIAMDDAEQWLAVEHPDLGSVVLDVSRPRLVGGHDKALVNLRVHSSDDLSAPPLLDQDLLYERTDSGWSPIFDIDAIGGRRLQKSK